MQTLEGDLEIVVSSKNQLLAEFAHYLIEALVMPVIHNKEIFEETKAKVAPCTKKSKKLPLPSKKMPAKKAKSSKSLKKPIKKETKNAITKKK